ncbi:MAG: site-specific integrase [Rhodothermales bacterium]
MGASVKLVLRKSKKRKDGKVPVWLRVTANRKTRFKSTGVWIEPKYWNERKQEVRGSHELYRSFNDDLAEMRLDAQAAAIRADSAAEVMAKVEGQTGSLTTFFEEFIEKLDAQGKYWEHKKYKVTLGKLQAVAGEAIDWSELDGTLLARFERHCREKRKNNPNTIRKELARLRRVVRQAIKDGVFDVANDPFLTYELPKRVAPDRRRLRKQELDALRNVDLTALDDEVDLARDAFIFAVYGAGVRFGDICQLRRADVTDGTLRYQMMKTGQRVEFPLPAEALAILDKWKSRGDGTFLFPFLQKGDDSDPIRLRRRISSRNAVANKNIKIAAATAEITNPDDVSFHVARHSFADLARRKSGNLYAISKALGHSNLNITERYLSSFDREAVNRLSQDMWSDEG